MTSQAPKEQSDGNHGQRLRNHPSDIQYRTATVAPQSRYPQELISALVQRHQRWFAEYGWR